MSNARTRLVVPARFLLRGVLTGIVVMALVVAALSDRRPRMAHAVDSISLTAITQLAGLSRPVGLTHAGDGLNRMYITQQTGQILMYNGVDPPSTLLDIQGLVLCCGEQGLLSVAFHPSFPATPYFYINYTNGSGDSVIARYTVTITQPGNVYTVNPAAALILKTISHPNQTNHNGGQLQFGPDGYLYFGMGDGGGGGDTNNNAQNINTLLGKMLRLDIDAPSPYIPATNPFVNQPGLDEIWAIGLRNPWRFSFDRTNGDLFIADVGQGAWEEVDVTPAGSPGGLNYGWHVTEGTHCFNPSTGCDQTGLVIPPIEYGHVDGNCSITGGYRYRGTLYPEFVGQYVYGDYCSGRIWSATPAGGGAWTSSQLLDTTLAITSFGEDEAGELYVVHHGSGTNGALYRINASPMADSDGDGCSNAEELGTDPVQGGQRSPTNQWDFYDVDDTKKVDAVDIGLVRSKFNGPGPTPPQDQIYDRRTGAHPWAPGAPDNKINAIDIALVRAEFNHSCLGFP